MTRPQLVVGAGKEKALLRRHPWLFSGAVARTVGDPAEGDVVDVVDCRGNWLAAGHYQHDTIVCKVLSFDTADIDRSFFAGRLASAIGYRRRLGFFDNPATNVFRLVHAEGDYMPGLVCDWYNGVLVMQAHSVGMLRTLPMLAELFVEQLGQYGIRAVYNKSAATVPGSSNAEFRISNSEFQNSGLTDGFLWGEEQPEVEVLESGIRMVVNVCEGQKTGFFVDQRENRALVGQLARGHRVLNCFGYTGGFSLAALGGGAEYVETVDVSRKAIDLCNSNVQLNFGSAAPHRGVVADVLQYIVGADFDFIILDPPAFAKSHRHLQQGLKGYRTINQRAMKALPVGGLLMTFSCSQAVSRDDFQTMVFTAAMNAGRRVRIVRQLPHAMDHPVSIHHPEGEYLKGLLLQVE